MQKKLIRVLHVLGTTNIGGAESRVMELYRAMDREAVQFDFLVHTDACGHYNREILGLGGKIYRVPRFKVYNYFAYKKALQKFFKEHSEYAVVHGHMTSTAAIYLPIAKNAGIPMAIAHARSAGVDKGVKGVLTKILRLPLKYRADHCFTCSLEAGIAVFGKGWVKKGKVWTIPNAIDARRFQYKEEIRNQVRGELGLSGKFVIGHVGSFRFMKNHAYLVKIFEECHKRCTNAVLVLIGTGELEQETKDLVKSFGLEEQVLFLGNQPEVERYYQAFDYFVFPSIFEGLPGSVAEAQAAGLHCLVSDKVTKEAALTELVSFKSIKESAVKWAEEILANYEAAFVRKDMQGIIEKKQFDVRRQAVEMEAFYRTGKNPPGHVTTVHS